MGIDNKTFYVTPQAPLPASTAVTLSVNGAEDIAGQLAPTTAVTFTTGLIPDTIRPSIVSMNPVYGSTNVPVNAVLQMMFDEPMDPGGIPADLACALYDNAIGTVAPQVLAVSPPATSGVPRNAVIEVLFNEPVRAATTSQVNVLVAGNPLPVAARTAVQRQSHASRLHRASPSVSG
jgi:Bacterial Ig-like domain